MSTPAQHPAPPPRTGHLVVCGDDALAQRLSYELAHVYGEHVAVLLPSVHRNHGPQIGDLARAGHMVSVIEAAEADDEALRAAGVPGALALALVYGDDRTNIHAALRARRMNPRIRLVIRLYNRKLGRHLEELLDRAAATTLTPAGGGSDSEVTATVLSDADTAAPALVAAAIAGAGKVIQADGLLLRATERTAPDLDATPYLYTLALSSEGVAGTPRLLPGEAEIAAADPARGRTVLETISLGEGVPGNRPRLPQGLPVASLFPRRLRYAVFGLAALLVLFAGLTWWVTKDPPLRAAYRSILDVFGMGDPAIGESTGRQILQVLSGLAGMALMPVLFAVVLESLGTFRTASSNRPPPRTMSDHVVLLGLGKIGTRVLERLSDLGIPVVCVERDPHALGVATAHARRAPVIEGDVTREGVLEAAHIGTSRVLLALTSDDAINLEAALYAREVAPELRVVMRLFDDGFAKSVYRTLRDSYPNAHTRSRSVSSLSAPAFAGAVMGRQILGAISVEREVLLFAAVSVGAHAELVGRTVEESLRPGMWRVLALDVSDPTERRADLAVDAAPQRDLVWDLHPGHILQASDRVVLAATRHGLAELLRHTA